MTDTSSTAALVTDYITRAQQFYAQGNLLESKAVYESALAINPRRPEAYLGLSIVYGALGEMSQAIQSLLRAADIEPTSLSAEAHINIGKALLEEGKPLEARRCFERALHSKGDSPALYTTLAELYERIGERGAAISLYREVISRWPDLFVFSNQEHINQSLAYKIGAIEENQNDLCDRLKDRLPRVATYDLNVQLPFTAGNSLARAGNLSQAEAVYAEAIKQHPQCAELTFNLGLIYYSRNLDHKAINLFTSLIEIEYRNADLYVILARLILRSGSDQSRFTIADSLLREAIRTEPHSVEAHSEMAALLQALGKTRESFTSYTHYVASKERAALASPLASANIRFITDDCTYALGHLAYLPDSYIKMQKLGMLPAHKTILLVRPWMVANPAFLNYWKTYFTIIDDPETIAQLRPIAKDLTYDTGIAPLPNGVMVNVRMAMSYVQREWERQDRAPLLSLSEQDYERGWACLEKLGVPKGSWFVTMHVREAGFKRAESCLHNAHRNADVLTFLKAAKEITNRGGWVIRIGEKLMAPMPLLDHVIDYAHSEMKTDWMDLFLMSKARFVMTTFSGVPLVAQTFGVPIILTNCPPTLLSYGSQDIFAPKLMFNTKQNRLVTFKEWLSPPILESEQGKMLSDLGFRFIDNTEDELAELASEMLNRLDGSMKYLVEEDADQEIFRSYLPADFGVISTRVGRDFMKRHRHLL